MAVTTTPNMGMSIPTPGSESGPDYAIEINSDLGILDSHDHSSGKGVQITPSGINISSDLSFLGNNATMLRSTRFTPSTVILGTDIGCMYVTGADLYYTDTAGNVVRLTQGGSIAGATGSIANLVSPASAVYNSGSATITFQSNTNTAASLDAGSITIREVLASAKGITLQSPTSLAADYSLTFPGSLPASQKFMTLDASGNIAAPWAVDGTSLEIASSTTLQIKTSGVSTAKIADGAVTTVKIADSNVTTAKIADANVTSGKVENSIDLPGTATTTSSRKIIVARSTAVPVAPAILWGNITISKTVGRGVGFSVASAGTVAVTITFSNAFNDQPVVTAVPENSSLIVGSPTAYCAVTSVSTSSVTIVSNAVGSGFVGFNFIAIGTI